MLISKALFSKSPNESSLSEEALIDIKNEAAELIEKVDSSCQKISDYIQQGMEVPAEENHDLFRSLHTLKSLAQMTSLNEIANMAHAMEDYVELIRSGKVKPQQDFIDLVVEAQEIFQEVYKLLPTHPSPSIMTEAERIASEFHDKTNAATLQSEVSGDVALQNETPGDVAPQNETPGEQDIEDFDTQNLNGSFPACDLDPELLQDFLDNAEDLLENLNSSMIELEGEPDSKKAIETIFRNVHTIKGTSGMFGFRAIEKLTHKMENIFDSIRKENLKATPSLMDGLFYSLDKVKAMFEAIKQNKSAELPINDAIQKLSLKETPVEQVKSQHEEQAKPQHEEQAKPQHEKQVKSQHEEQVKPQHEEADVKKNQEEKKPTEDTESTGTIRVDLRRLDSLVNLVGELVIDRTRFARIEEELRTLGMP
jgi:chemotaxis protein histidine kinase CheA